MEFSRYRQKYGEWLTSSSGNFTPGKETQYPLNIDQMGPTADQLWVPSGLLEKRKKSLAPTGFEPRNVQPVA